MKGLLGYRVKRGLRSVFIWALIIVILLGIGYLVSQSKDFFKGYSPKYYEPKDTERGEWLERKYGPKDLHREEWLR